MHARLRLRARATAAGGMVLDASLEACLARGGVVVDGPRGMGEQRFAVIRDPAGAHMGLIGPKA